MTITNVSYLGPQWTMAGPVPHFAQAEAAALHTLSMVLCAPSGQCTVGKGIEYSAGQLFEVECIAGYCQFIPNNRDPDSHIGDKYSHIGDKYSHIGDIYTTPNYIGAKKVHITNFKFIGKVESQTNNLKKV